MTRTAPPPRAERVIRLLDRLDPRLDAPCGVPGCVHLHPGEVRSAEEPTAARRAA